MRVWLVDIRSRRGFVSKDTVVGGYGSRLDPFSRVTRVIAYLKRQFHDIPSIHLAYAAAILARAGHDVRWSRGDAAVARGDIALVLSSIVDHKNETAIAARMRGRGARVGFIGIAASKLPQLFADYCDFILCGEPEAGVMRLARGGVPSGLTVSEAVADLDGLPFPRWDLVADDRWRFGIKWSSRPVGGGFPLLASRGCPEFCTYCPHRILAGYRVRSVKGIVDELEQLCDEVRRPYVIFRDPLFSADRDRVLALCDEIKARNLTLTFEAETRLDRLDVALLDVLYDAGFRAMSFGVESLDTATLRKSGRRPIPQAQQRQIIEYCRCRGIVTAAFYVFGFLQDTWSSVAATIDYAIDLGSTFAQFKLLTPYPGTPMFRQLEPLVTEIDWERFDGYTPTFRHPNLTASELMFLLGTAYKRFYMRPSYLANFLEIRNRSARHWITHLDRRVQARQERDEIEIFPRAVTC
jgi:anaerobic magnesium-protoporphyrin IX monomethyl ester cyclase